MLDVIIWLVVAVVAIIIDVVTSSFIFMWFSIGALAAIILSFFGVSMAWQFIVFLITGIILIAIGYPWAKKKFKVEKNHTLTMEQTYIGRVMKANEEIVEKAKIKVDGIYWTAYNKGNKINKDDQFVITGIEGNKLIVELKEK
ncbi:NfeD family protein [Clostridium sp. NSJ-6]|mgnify:FL=1|uniref:NfeD family protein n=1 Tax=Clostridium hominis TaxID=2763036 RepID=A0ABR7DAG2_9CLOT|nr:NfeD family protein [Clostridium hominis]MBC5628389.1 NfeD family protein [Clostridium hominis]MDU2671144.1 NfeD family protein [Clostridium sp.]